MSMGRSQLLRGLSRWSAAARFLGLRVRIPTGHGCLSLVRVVFRHVQVFTSAWSFVQRSVSSVVCPVSVIAKPRKGRMCPGIGSKRHRKKMSVGCFWFREGTSGG
jgi:hypothetical protein